MKAYFVYGGLLLCLFSLSVFIRRDWQRLAWRSRRVLAETIDHRQRRDADGVIVWAAIYRFVTEQGQHEIVDRLYTASPKTGIGTTVTLTFPSGRPDLAERARPVLWLAIYAFLLFALGMLVYKAHLL